MDPVVSSRVHPSPSSHSSSSRLTNHSSSSPSNARIAHSASTASSSNFTTADGIEMTPPVSLDDVLAQHATASDPLRAALDSLLAERNTLKSQNVQLWNLLKRSRNTANGYQKDLSRIRAERDALKSKVQKLGKADAAEHGHIEPQPRPSTSSGHTTTASSSSAPRQSEDSVTSSSNISHIAPYVNGFSTHSSRHTATKKPSTSSLEPDAEGSLLPYARQSEPNRELERERNISQPTPTTSVNYSSSSTSTQIVNGIHRQRTESRDSSTSTVAPHPRAHPAPLLIPARSESLPTSPPSLTTDTIPPNATKPLRFVPKRHSSSPGPLNNSPPTINLPGSSMNGVDTVSLNGTSSQLGLGQVSRPSSAGASNPVSLGPVYLSSPTTRQHSRESINLPDEAKHFIVNMPDSPLPSPRSGGEKGWNVQRSLTGERTLAHVPEEGERSTDTSPKPFLDLGDDSDSERRGSEDARSTRNPESDSELDPERAIDGASEFGYKSRQGDLSKSAQTPKTRAAGSTVDEFPLPPATFATSVRPSLSPTKSTGASAPTNLSAAGSSNSSTLSPSMNSTSDSKRSRDQNRDSFILPTKEPSATFRQMPLLNTDLKKTTVNVIGSQIRPNDKGKDVLSFVMAVNVVGKEGWTIEKFYSDVLALDSRLKNQISRSTAKKLAPLPDSKLFKDHAPAKVDQRKALLQAYLQSVLLLPIKDKNEIIVFFSSDVMRERAPVTQSGYKEGYLTKRGKNFGGWKTRYFVLQGPVLEYYESRGGAHLGSIQITGAQIGRQQKPAGRHESDDENEFRHAFLIVEAMRKGPAGSNIRHVLCAESDSDRDAWVEVLVRYITGQYSEDPVQQAMIPIGQPRTSTSSVSVNEINTTPSRRITKDSITKLSATPVPISLLSHEKAHAKFFQAAPIPDDSSSSPAKSSLGPSPIERTSTSSFSHSDSRAQSAISGDEGQLSSSLPTSSNLDPQTSLAPIGQRSNSELGHYPDLHGHHQGMLGSPEQTRAREQRLRASYHPSLGTIVSSPIDRPVTPENSSPATMSPSGRLEGGSRQVKISGPLNGQPIPHGYKFGAKDDSNHSNERERKAKSRGLWGLMRPGGSSVPTMVPRNVFGVPLEESLAVSQIANLPAIVFRCIQYLEAKKAEQEEGIYRLSGSSAVIKSLKDRFNTEGDVDLLGADEDWDPHAIAGLLKCFLRELPTSILTRDLHLKFLAALDFVDTDERIKDLQMLTSALPFANYSLLRAMTAHLILIVQNSNVNKMTMKNVGIVFSPTLGIPAGVFSLMLGEFKRVFNVDGEGSDSPAEEDDVAPSPKRLSALSRRNSKQYTDAAADQLLGLVGRTLPATEEDGSDDGDGDVLSVDDDSDEETTEADTAETEAQTVESSVDSARAPSPAPPPATYQEQLIPPTPAALDPNVHRSHASNVAASRGLNISVGPADRPRSRMFMGGLPASPRPATFSPVHTPTSIASGPHLEAPSTPR